MNVQGTGALLNAQPNGTLISAEEPCCCGEGSPPNTWSFQYARKCSDHSVTTIWDYYHNGFGVWYHYGLGECIYILPEDEFRIPVNTFPAGTWILNEPTSYGFGNWDHLACDHEVCHGTPPPPPPPDPPFDPDCGCGVSLDHQADDDYCLCLPWKIRATVTFTTPCVCFTCGDVEPTWNAFSSGFGADGIYDMTYAGTFGGKHTWINGGGANIDIDRGNFSDGACTALNQASVWFAVLQKIDAQWWAFALFNSDVGYIDGDPRDLTTDFYQLFAFRGSSKGDNRGCLGVPSMTNENTACECRITVSGGMNIGHSFIAHGGSVSFDACTHASEWP